MVAKKSHIPKPSVTFREANEDLVNSIREVLERDSLTQEDKEWLAGELDGLIESLQKAKTKLANKKAA
ncbi:MAG: hypothetical protein IT258_05905 [Saprospiraceae bacterium]|nr:hypothetical protein [Saprospiraceae bacterium]